MLRHCIRILPPLFLIALGLWLLSGCIYIPTFDSVKQGRNASKEVGDARSKKPLRVGLASRDEVLRILGQPPLITEDRSKFAYTWEVTRGVWIMPLCFDTRSIEGHRMLVLSFDSAGILRDFGVKKSDERVLSIFSLYPTGRTLLFGPGFRANPDYDPSVKSQHRPATTRPTTQTQP